MTSQITKKTKATVLLTVVLYIYWLVLTLAWPACTKSCDQMSQTTTSIDLLQQDIHSIGY